MLATSNRVYILLFIFLLFTATNGRGRGGGRHGGSRSGGSHSGGSHSGGSHSGSSHSGGSHGSSGSSGSSHTSHSISTGGLGGSDSGSSSSRNTGGSSGSLPGHDTGFGTGYGGSSSHDSLNLNYPWNRGSSAGSRGHDNEFRTGAGGSSGFETPNLNYPWNTGSSGSSGWRDTGFGTEYGGSSGYETHNYPWNTGSSGSSRGRNTDFRTDFNIDFDLEKLGIPTNHKQSAPKPSIIPFDFDLEGLHSLTNRKQSATKPSSIPSYSPPSQTYPHSQSHIIPVSTGARTPNKPTSRPLTPTNRPVVAQTHRPNTSQTTSTPRPITHHSSSGGRNSTGGNYGGSGNSNHTITGIGRIGGNGKMDDKVQKTEISGHQSGRNTTGGLSHSIPTHSPSAPSAPINTEYPNAPPAHDFMKPSGVGAHQPPGPGWHPSSTHDAVQKQHVGGSQSGYPQPPPYPGGGYPQQPPPYPEGGYPQGGQYPHGQAPPVYPGNVHYPNQPPPPYNPSGQGPQGHYPAGHYPTQPGGPAYYPQPPPPPPGYSPYGTPYYKDKSGIKASHVVAGLALWELTRSNQHHHSGYGFGVQRPTEIHHHHYNDGAGNTGNGNQEIMYNQPTYHDVMRERYTTRITPTSQNPTGPGAYNILEMTHYITPDEKGEIYSTMGNMTCTSVYNARSVSNIHMKQVNEFKKQYPNSVFPLYRNENETYPDNFTIVPGRIIHKEPVSITCCGTDKEMLDISLLTNGKHPNVNCVNHIGHIPIRKITFIKTVEVVKPNGEWHQIELVNPNITTPNPLASFSTINNSTPTPLAPYTTSSNLSTPSTSFSNASPVPETHLPMVVSSSPTVDMSQTFGPHTSGVDMNQTFAIGSSTEDTIEVTSNPSDLVVG